MKKIISSRIIFIGGSNVRYGINSEIIKDSLKINPINTAVSAGLGLKFIIDDIRPYLKPHDIVILSPEYEHFYGEYIWGNDKIAQEINICPEDFTTLNFNQLKILAGSLPHFNIKKLVESLKLSVGFKDKFFVSSYESMTGMNQFGDTYSHWKMKSIPYLSKRIIGNYNTRAIEMLTDLNDFIVKKLKGKLYIALPPYAKSEYGLNKNKVDFVSEKFTETNIAQLGNLKTSILDDSLFFNSPYHLTQTGGNLRTMGIIKELRLKLKK